MRRALCCGLAALLLLTGCQATGRFIRELLEERPAAPLDQLRIASDARIDSLGRVAGSFVGHGTSRAVHLVSSDTALIAALVRRYRPELVERRDVWSALARARLVTIAPRRPGENPDRGPQVDQAYVGSPNGHTGVVVAAILLRGSQCGWRGAQAELIVEESYGRGGWPALTGPVVASVRRAGDGYGLRDDFVRRRPPAEPSAALVDELVDRTRADLDSLLERNLPRGARPLDRPLARRLDINSLEDLDAADVVPFYVSGEAVRYAVALRETRLAASGDTLLVAGVMIHDSAGAWRQTVFQPTALRLRRGRLEPLGGLPPVFWRRLEGLTGFGTGRDYLWLEQVSPGDGEILWGLVAPRGNIPVAVAAMAGPCL